MARTKAKHRRTRSTPVTSSTFKRNCKCTFHHVFFEEDDINGKLFNVKNREIRAVYLDYIADTNSLGVNAKLICRGCVDIVKKKVDGCLDSKGKDSVIPKLDEVVKDVVEELVQDVIDEVDEVEEMEEDVDYVPDDVMAVISSLKEGKLSVTLRSLLAEALGKSIEKDLYQETKASVDQRCYRDLPKTHSVKDLRQCLQKRNQVLVSFLLGAALPKYGN